MKGQTNLLMIALFLLLTLGSMFAVVNMMQNGNLDMTYQVNASVSNYSYQDSDWLTQNRDYQNMRERGGDLSPDNNQEGFWISEPVNTTENFGIPQSLVYNADMGDGEGTITVRSFDSEPTGQTGTNEIDLQAEEENSQNIQYVNGGIELQ